MHILQALRGLTPNAILTGNMRPSQHKHWKLRAATGEAPESQQQTTVADAQHQCCGELKHKRPSATAICTAGRKYLREKRHACKEGSSAADKRPQDAQNYTKESPHFAPDEKLLEEEKRTRKRAKKLRQKLAQETDPERKAQEQQKRAKRRASKKAKLSQTD